MISIIICSRSCQLASDLSTNIKETIGCGYELHIVDNAIRNASIFEVYNEGLTKAKGEYVVFVHEDVLFLTNNWGKILIQHFESNKRLGLVGVAGAHYISRLPMAWWFSLLHYENIVQTTPENAGTIRYECCQPNENNEFPVCALDGVFMCAPTRVLKNIKFDSNTFNGFHMYDYDLSLQVLQKGYSVACIPDILIEHSSYGNKDKGWYEALLQFNSKWKARLPLQTVPISKHDLQYADFQIAWENVRCMKRYYYPMRDYIRLFRLYIFNSNSSLFYLALLLRKSLSGK